MVDVGLEFFEYCYMIGMWWWEVLCFLECWCLLFEYVDEIWVGSCFVVDMLIKVLLVLVVYILMLVILLVCLIVVCVEFGLFEDFVYLFVYDYNLIFVCKN